MDDNSPVPYEQLVLALFCYLLTNFYKRFASTWAYLHCQCLSSFNYQEYLFLIVLVTLSLVCAVFPLGLWSQILA